MDIVNDLTKCNYFYYLLNGSLKPQKNTLLNSKPWVLFKLIKISNQNYDCIADALLRFRVPNVKPQYNYISNNNFIKVINSELNDKILFEYAKLNYLYVIQYLMYIRAKINQESTNLTNYNLNVDTINYLTNLKYNHIANVAARHGHLKLVKYFVAQGLDINERPEHRYGDLYDYLNNPTLDNAVHYNNLNVVKYLVEQGAKISDYNMNHAVQTGNLTLVNYLYLQGGNIYEGANTLLYVAIAQNINMIEYFINKGLDLHHVSDRLKQWYKGMIDYVIKYGNLEVLQYLVAIGLNIYQTKYLEDNIYQTIRSDRFNDNDYQQLEQKLQYLKSVGLDLTITPIRKRGGRKR